MGKMEWKTKKQSSEQRYCTGTVHNSLLFKKICCCCAVIVVCECGLTISREETLLTYKNTVYILDRDLLISIDLET